MAKRKKKSTILGLDLGTQAIKAVEMTRVGEELAVTGCTYEPVEDPTRYGEYIRAAVEAGAFKVNRVVVGFSGRSTLLQTVTIPPDRTEELNDAILEEAEKYVPYDMAEAQLDYHILEGEDTRQVKALLVAVRQRDIEDKLEVIFGAGINPMRVDVELVALANAFETANSAGGLIADGKPAGIVDFGASKTLITVTDGVNHVFREFAVGGITLTEMVAQRVGCSMDDAETMKLNPGDKMEIVKDAIYPGIEDITAEIRACLDSFKVVSSGRDAGQILLTGGLVSFPGVVPLIGRLTKTDAKPFDTFGAVEMADAEGSDIASHLHDFIVAFGLACHARD